MSQGAEAEGPESDNSPANLLTLTNTQAKELAGRLVTSARRRTASRTSIPARPASRRGVPARGQGLSALGL